jgi:addiction module HigA family antidote
METSETFILNDDNLTGSVHPGSILKDELRERKISQKEFAASIGMQASHLSALIHGVRNVTADIAQRLEKALDIPAYIWMNLQSQYQLEKTRQTKTGNSAKSSYVYPAESFAPSLVLGERKAPAYGSSSISMTIRLPKDDIMILSLLSERMGWVLNTDDNR